MAPPVCTVPFTSTKVLRDGHVALIGPGYGGKCDGQLGPVAILACRLEALAAGNAGCDDSRIHEKGPDTVRRRGKGIRAGDVHQFRKERRRGVPVDSVFNCTARSARLVSVRAGRKSSMNGSAACSPRVSGA
jgi:hypothetical protein